MNTLGEYVILVPVLASRTWAAADINSSNGVARSSASSGCGIAAR
jgi:hypothetical protein